MKMKEYFKQLVPLVACYNEEDEDKNKKEPGIQALPTDYTETSSEDGEEEVYECLYDQNVTHLFQCLEDNNWIAAYELMQKDFTGAAKGESAADQAKTWVSKYHPETGKLVWSQLPLHAAIIFKAPFKVVECLINLYPRALKCRDDQGNLPLHLAFRSSCTDKTLKAVLTGYPRATTVKGHMERLPHEMCGIRYHIMQTYINETKVSMRHMEIESKERVKRMKHVVDEERQKLKIMEKAYETEKDQVEILQEKVYCLKRKDMDVAALEAKIYAADIDD